jgi:hypothetical protein
MGLPMRMIAALSLALMMFATSDLPIAAEPVPLKTVRKIRAAYGPATYLPTQMARGYNFRTWWIDDLYSEVLEETEGLRDVLPELVLDFWRGKGLLHLVQWAVFDARETAHPCSAPFVKGTITRVINGRAIHSLHTGGGRDTWTCVPYPAGPRLMRRVQVKLYSDRLAVGTAMRIVGTARRIP